MKQIKVIESSGDIGKIGSGSQAMELRSCGGGSINFINAICSKENNSEKSLEMKFIKIKAKLDMFPKDRFFLCEKSKSIDRNKIIRQLHEPKPIGSMDR